MLFLEGVRVQRSILYESFLGRRVYLGQRRRVTPPPKPATLPRVKPLFCPLARAPPGGLRAEDGRGVPTENPKTLQTSGGRGREASWLLKIDD